MSNEEAKENLITYLDWFNHGSCLNLNVSKYAESMKLAIKALSVQSDIGLEKDAKEFLRRYMAWSHAGNWLYEGWVVVNALTEFAGSKTSGIRAELEGHKDAGKKWRSERDALLIENRSLRAELNKANAIIKTSPVLSWFKEPTETFEGLFDSIELSLSEFSSRLINLAEWFDSYDMKTVGHLNNNEVQLTLRKIANRLTNN